MRKLKNKIAVFIRIAHIAIICLVYMTAFLSFNILSNTESRDKIKAYLLRNMFESLGPSFLKIGQILSTREDLLPKGILRILKQLHDNVRPFSNKEAKKIVISECGNIFSSFVEEPLASGSVAQVHKAQLVSGDCVAVKIQRPNIRNTMLRDLKCLITISRFVKKFETLKKIPLEEIFNQIGKSLIEQTDFTLEADANALFEELFAEDESIRLPKIYREYTTPKILVMEYFGDLKRFDDPRIDLESFTKLSKLSLHVLYSMVFKKGVIHCDLHPANLCVNPDGDLVILDTGFIAKFSEKGLAQYRDFFIGIVSNAGKKCAKIVFETATTVYDDFEYATFEKDIEAHINKFSKLKAGDFQVTEFAYQLFEIQRKHGLYATSEFIMAIIAMLVVEGNIKHRLPDLDFQTLAVPYLKKKPLQATIA
jgi:ubiquinone biosynthesis protein